MWIVIDASGDNGLTVRHISHYNDKLVCEDAEWKFRLRKAYFESTATVTRQ